MSRAEGQASACCGRPPKKAKNRAALIGFCRLTLTAGTALYECLHSLTAHNAASVDYLSAGNGSPADGLVEGVLHGLLSGEFRRATSL
jgi:hypothetical protein